MSSRRSSRSRHRNDDVWNETRMTGVTDDQISDLVSKLQHLIPELRRRHSDKVSASKLLQETCNYIRSLHQEVDDLSDRLVRILGSNDEANSDQAAAIIRSLLLH